MISVAIAGGSQNVLFCEGEPTSLDVEVYSMIYQRAHVYPLQGCDSVIENTRRYKEIIAKTGIKRFVEGVLDKDLKKRHDSSVVVLQTVDIESLLCTEDVIRVVLAFHNCSSDADKTIPYVWSGLWKDFVEDSDQVALQLAKFKEENGPLFDRQKCSGLNKSDLKKILRIFNVSSEVQKLKFKEKLLIGREVSHCEIEEFNEQLRTVSCLDQFCQTWKLKSENQTKNQSLLSYVSRAIFGNVLQREKHWPDRHYLRIIRQLIFRNYVGLREALL